MTSFVVTGRRDQLSELSKDQEGWASHPLDVSGRWPSLNSNGLLWTCSFHPTPPAVGSTLSVHAVTPGETVRLYQADFPGAIAPRVPLYVNPSPAGDRAALVAPGDNALSLEIVRVEGDPAHESTRWNRIQCGVGGPIFPAWSPGGSKLAVHRGIVLEVLDEDGELEDRREGASAFRTPAWSPDGDYVAFASVRDESVGELLVARPGRLAASDAIAEFRTGMTIGWRPHSPWVTVATAADASASVFSSLVAVHSTNGERIEMYVGPFNAFWWDPTGELVVLAIPTQAGDGSIRLLALDPAGTIAGASENIVPSDDMRLAMAFFDQYSLSHSPWARGGGAFFVSGRLPGDARPSTFGDIAYNYVFGWDAHQAAPLVPLAKGEFAAAVL